MLIARLKELMAQCPPGRAENVWCNDENDLARLAFADEMVTVAPALIAAAEALKMFVKAETAWQAWIKEETDEPSNNESSLEDAFDHARAALRAIEEVK